MDPNEYPDQWRELSEHLLTGMAEWRQQHPRATLKEIEAAFTERLAPLRTRVLQDTALASPAADWSTAAPAQRPTCPACGTPLHSRGKRRRHIQSFGGADLTLERHYATCPQCGGGLFPPR